MDDMTDLTGFDWDGFVTMLKTTGVDFGLQVIIALVIFIVGRIVARMIQKGIRKMMEAQEMDKILQSFIGNLAYWTIMIFVIIAAINQVGIQTTSLIAVMYVWKIVEAAWFRELPERNAGATEAPLKLLIPVWILTAANIWFGIDTRWSAGIASQAADVLLGAMP